ncbi:uncharacterized protein [Antedon mediterranea]|uniref:uncharacterized protein n=1 Tax=Antedon mediterranea TaxID=105859 RepID=UPI003AF45C3E
MAKPEGGVQEEANLAVPSSKMEEEAQNDPLDPNAELKIKGKKSYFQITSIKDADNSGVNNEDIDSNDELDESRADDTSIISDASKSTADLERSLRSLSPQPSSNSPPLEEKSSKASVQDKGANNGNGPSRFKVVKVAHVEPVHKGRWTCKDFFHGPPVANVNVNESVNTNSVNSIVENKSEKDATNSEASSAASSVHLPGHDLVSESTGTENKKVNDTKAGKEKTDSVTQPSIGLEGLIHELGSDGARGPGDLSHDGEGKDGAGAGGEIDNKIEQAMDLVKSHLLYAVREEVLELKEKIKVLTEENNKLKRENNALRQKQAQTTAVHQHSHPSSTHHSPARSEQQYSEVQQSTSLHQSQMSMQQSSMHTSLVGQQQLPKQPMQQTYAINQQIPQQQNQLPQITPDQPTYNQYQSVPRQDSSSFQVAPSTSSIRQDSATSQPLQQQRADQIHYQQVVQQQTHKP